MDQTMALVKKMVRAFYPFAKKKLGFNRPVRLFLRHDAENALNPLGKTAFYDPENLSITAYITSRHPKDIVRSIAHELVHHKQNCENRLNNVNTDNITESSHLKHLEEEAYKDGNSCFREWEDRYKLQEKNVMSEKQENEFSGDLTENDTIKEVYVKRAPKVAEQVAKRFGFTFNLTEDKVENKGGESKWEGLEK